MTSKTDSKVIDCGVLVITPEIIDDTIVLLMQDGWCTGNYGESFAGPNCINGALCVSMGIDPTNFLDRMNSEFEQLIGLYREGDLYREEDRDSIPSLTALNDDEFHTVEDAIDFLEWLRDCALEN